MQFFSPKGFKSGAYYFNKYDTRDLLILIPSGIVAVLFIIGGVLSLIITENFITLLICWPIGLTVMMTSIILTMPQEIYHNVLGKIISIVHFKSRQKKFIWHGYDYDNYREEDN